MFAQGRPKSSGPGRPGPGHGPRLLPHTLIGVPSPADVPPSASVTWLGHTSAVIDIAGVKILTDPALTPRVAHLRRHHTVDVAAIGRPDLVLISHLHMDHLHVPSLRLFGAEVPLVVPAGAGDLLRRKGFRDVARSASRHHDRRRPTDHRGGPGGAQRPAAVPAQRVRADAVGYVLRAAGAAVYFPGDTDLFDEMGSWAPVDVALLPIWGWGPSLGEGHLDPAGAVAATGLVEPRLVVPIHWGTFSPLSVRQRRPAWLDEPVERFRAGLDDAGIGERLHVLTPGDTLAVPAHPTRHGAT